MKSFAFVLLALFSFSQVAIAQSVGQGRLPGFQATGAPVEQWPAEVVERVASAPESYSGAVPISQVVKQVIEDLSGPESTVDIKFKIPVIQDSQVLINSPVMDTLPMDQASSDINSYGFTDEEMRSSRFDAVVSVPFSLSDYQEKAAGGDSVPFSLHVEQSLERYFVSGYAKASSKRGGRQGLEYNPGSPNCGGAAVGTELTLTVSNRPGTVVNTYECMTRSDWYMTSSDFYPRDVTEI